MVKIQKQHREVKCTKCGEKRNVLTLIYKDEFKRWLGTEKELCETCLKKEYG